MITIVIYELHSDVDKEIFGETCVRLSEIDELSKSWSPACRNMSLHFVTCEPDFYCSKSPEYMIKKFNIKPIVTFLKCWLEN